jgi:hypothetical protein
MPTAPCTGCGMKHPIEKQRAPTLCGPTAARLASMLLTENEPPAGCAQSILMATKPSGGGKSGTDVDDMIFYLSQLGMVGEKVIAVGDGFAGELLRASNSELHDFPVLCNGLVQSPGGRETLHWIVVAKRTKNVLSTDSFCVLEPYTGTVFRIPIKKKDLISFNIPVNQGTIKLNSLMVRIRKAP